MLWKYSKICEWSVEIRWFCQPSEKADCLSKQNDMNTNGFINQYGYKCNSTWKVWNKCNSTWKFWNKFNSTCYINQYGDRIQQDNRRIYRRLLGVSGHVSTHRSWYWSDWSGLLSEGIEDGFAVHLQKRKPCHAHILYIYCNIYHMYIYIYVYGWLWMVQFVFVSTQKMWLQ